MNLKTLKILTIVLLFNSAVNASDYIIRSPDNNLKAEVIVLEKIYYRVSFKGSIVMQASPISLEINNSILGQMPRVSNFAREEVNQTIQTVWGSRKVINDHYNKLTVQFQGNFSVEFRVYNHGVAYRFITDLGDKEVIVNNEEVAFRFDFGTHAWLLDRQSYESSFHRISLDVEEISDFKSSLEKIYLPAFIEAKNNIKIAITEAGLYDYPSLFLQRGNDYENYLLGTFERYALSTKRGGFSNYSQLVDKSADFIAKTKGTRTFPWRLMVVSDNDAVFADNDLVYQLAKPCAMKDTEWIKPGKVAWEWWHDYVVEGQDFEGGINTATYLYQIDFAAKYGIEYILVDWMWTDKYDLSLFNPAVDIRKIINYGKDKNVRVILWCPGHTLHEQLNKALDLFEELGAAGVKADFFGREDQTCISMYEDIAIAAAKRKMLVDFHGCTKPTGIERTYPNIINYEAVLGNEYNKLEKDRCTIRHKVELAFTRGMIGPMDFTPGGMRNRIDKAAVFFTMPQVFGTRSGEISLYVIYNEPLKMLCDSPSIYEKEPEIPTFISKIPTSWDETKVLDGIFGEYVVKARKTGETWYVAGLNGEKARVYNLNLSFLPTGKYTCELLRDGDNAGKVGTDFKIEKTEMNNQSDIPIWMFPGGGFTMRIEPK